MIVERLLRVALLGSVWVLYLLMALSVLSLGTIIERWLYFRARRDPLPSGTLYSRVASALLADDLPTAERVLGESRTVEAHAVIASLRWRDGGAEAVSDALESELGRLRSELERGTNLLGTLGSNAPFVGLFGTVIGVIDAFNHLGRGAGHGAGAGMGNVMTGIAEALVATAVGIFVALPAVVAYNLVQKKIGEIETGTAALGRLVSAFLKREERRVPAVILEPRMRAHVNGTGVGMAHTVTADAE